MVELCNQMFLKNVDVIEDDICILKIIKLLIPIRAEPCMWIAYKIILQSAKKTIASCNNQDSRATMVIEQETYSFQAFDTQDLKVAT